MTVTGDNDDSGGEVDLAKLAPRKRHLEREEAEREAMARVDGRTLRRKGRTETLSFKTRPETVALIQHLAQAQGITMIEALEAAIEEYDRALRGKKS